MAHSSRKPVSSNRPPNTSARPSPALAVQWRRLWADFEKKHRAWLNRIAPEDATYSLPDELIGELTMPRGDQRRLPALLMPEDAEAEGNFTKLCREFRPYTIGIFQNSPLTFPLLSDSWPIEGRPDPQAGDDEQHFAQDVANDHRQQLAYAASLSFHAPYLRELKQLGARWQALTKPRPPVGPFGGLKLAQNLGVSGEPAFAYYQAYERFCGRWHLSMLVSWEIPWPKGRDNGLWTVEEFLKYYGPYPVVAYVPPYLNTRAVPAQEKLRLVAAMAKYFPATMAQLPTTGIAGQGAGPPECVNAFRMFLMEVAVYRRYGEPRGIVARLTRGFAAILHLSEEHIRRLRRTYAKFPEI